MILPVQQARGTAGRWSCGFHGPRGQGEVTPSSEAPSEVVAATAGHAVGEGIEPRAHPPGAHGLGLPRVGSRAPGTTGISSFGFGLCCRFKGVRRLQAVIKSSCSEARVRDSGSLQVHCGFEGNGLSRSY